MLIIVKSTKRLGKALVESTAMVEVSNFKAGSVHQNASSVGKSRSCLRPAAAGRRRMVQGKSLERG